MLEVTASSDFMGLYHQDSTNIKTILKGKKILFIDDDYVNYIYFKELIKPSGAVLCRAISILQAIHHLKTDREIEFVILSLERFQATDQKIIETIRSIFPNIPILMITDNDSYLSQSCITAGCDSFLHRHTDFDQLVDTIEDLLEERSFTD